MAEFPEKVRLEAKRLSAFKCCYCHERPGDDVHHIHPQKDGGSNDIGNAAYLCAQCHRDHGNNPDKQKRVLEARDWWYEVVRTRYAPPALDILQSFVEVVATKDDVARVEQNLRGMLDDVINAYKGGDTTGFELINVASTMVSSTKLSAERFYLHTSFLVSSSLHIVRPQVGRLPSWNGVCGKVS